MQLSERPFRDNNHLCHWFVSPLLQRNGLSKELWQVATAEKRGMGSEV
jgi:hypothetical protein